MNRAILVAMFLLAACGKTPANNSAAPANDAAAVSAPTANTAEAVVALSEPQRRAVLFRAIRAAGLDCQQVTGAERIPDAPQPRWRADCDTGDQYLVDIGPNGTAYVTSPVRR